MAVLDVYDTNRNKVSQTKVSDKVFDAKIKEHLFYDVIRMQMTKRRRGTASTKTRNSVRGGGKKPWRQKGTGRARAGTSRSPLWRGGGVVFGPLPRAYALTVPKKVRKLALCSALTLKRKENKMLVIDGFKLQEMKTKSFVEALNKLGLQNVLIIEQENIPLEKSARNVPHVKVLRPEGLNLYDLLCFKNLVITEHCLEKIQGRLLL